MQEGLVRCLVARWAATQARYINWARKHETNIGGEDSVWEQARETSSSIGVTLHREPNENRTAEGVASATTYLLENKIGWAGTRADTVQPQQGRAMTLETAALSTMPSQPQSRAPHRKI